MTTTQTWLTKRIRVIAVAAAAAATLGTVAAPVSPVDAASLYGCTYKQTSAPGFQAQCSTQAPGTEFRVGIRCKYRQGYKHSKWAPQGMGTYAGVG